ncbi:hypothetical protein HRED_00798 [Candidatus Haloredivivus sp. G17]|nr:hypothetical protein HRED_00798 [Candidatus Haloredivivus sp. G17]
MSRKRDYSEEVFTSEFAYKILREIYTGNARNPTNIAESLDSTYYSVNNYMKGFRELEFIQSERDGKKKLYSVDTNSIYNFWISRLSSTLQDLEDKIESDKLEKYEFAGINQDKYFKEHEVEEIEFSERIKETLKQKKSSWKFIEEYDTLKRFFYLWFEFYMDEKHESTLENLLFHDLEIALHSVKDIDNEILNENFQEEIETILFALDPISDGESISIATRVAVIESLKRNQTEAATSEILDNFDSEEIAEGLFENLKEDKESSVENQ